MAEFNIVDEAILDATPEEIDEAFSDEAAGRSAWWAPNVQMRSRDGREINEVGAVVDYRVSPRGRVDRPGAVRFATRVIERGPGRVVTEYFDGAFRGRAVFTVEQLPQGKVRVRNDWQTRTHGLIMGLLARIDDIGAGHSRIMQEGFAGMARHIAAQRAARRSTQQM